MESFRQALAAGAECVEFDVRLSADGIPVVVHDPTLDRTTDSIGAVASLTVEQLRAADAGARFTRDGGRTFPYREKGLCVPTLEDVLTELADVPLLLEIKTAEVAPAARRVIERHGAELRCVIASFDARAIDPFRGSRIATGASRAEVVRLMPRIVTRQPVRSLPFSVMCLPPRLRGVPIPIAALVSLTRPAGCLVHVWTINAPDEARHLWSLGVRGIVSDDPALMRRTRDAAPNVSAARP